MSDTIKVRGGANGPVFIEGALRELDAEGKDLGVIREGQVVEVPNTLYYRRAIQSGDLVAVTEDPDTTPFTRPTPSSPPAPPPPAIPTKVEG